MTYGLKTLLDYLDRISETFVDRELGYDLTMLEVLPEKVF